MVNKHPDLSKEIYHRIYRLGIRKVDAHLIAAALKVPVKTVQNILDRFFSDPHADQAVAEMHAVNAPASLKSDESELFNFFVFSKPRYAVVDIGGDLKGKNCGLLEEELKKLTASGFKAIAIRLTDVYSLNEEGAKVLLHFYQQFTEKNRYAAILDPADEIEHSIVEYQLNEKVPIFGTEHAFEEAAFRIGSDFKKKKF